MFVSFGFTAGWLKKELSWGAGYHSVPPVVLLPYDRLKHGSCFSTPSPGAGGASSGVGSFQAPLPEIPP